MTGFQDFNGAYAILTDRAIDVHITAVRKKLGDLSWMIHTVRGVGYHFLERKEDESVASAIGYAPSITNSRSPTDQLSWSAARPAPKHLNL